MSGRSVAFMVLLAAASPAFAQSPTAGSVAGRVTDSSGGVLQGTTVMLSGPAVQGVRTAATDAEGLYHFYNVPPGRDYKVEAARKGLQTTSRGGIQVFLGQETAISLSLAPAGVRQEVTVTAAAPTLDLTMASTGVNITSNLILTLPTARTFQQLTTLAPSVSLDMGDHDRRFETSPNVGASSAPENNYIIDGLSATDPRFGTSGANLTMNFVQEVQVLTAGYQAEYGRSTGGLFNVVTKSGGNTYTGDIFSYFRNKALTPDGVVRRENKELVTFADRVSDFDMGLSLGGPVMKDKLWFFGAYDPGRQTTHLGGQVQTGVAPSTVNREYTRTGNVYAGKATWTFSPRHSVVLSVFGDPTSRNGWLTNPNADASAALRDEKTGGHNQSLKYNVMFYPTWFMEMTVGRHAQRNRLDPATAAGLAVPQQIDETIGGYAHGGFQRHQADRSARRSFGFKFTNLVGLHELHYGFDAEMNGYNGNLHETWYRFFGPSLGFGTYVQERSYSVVGSGTTSNAAIFLQDSWRARSNVRVNLGLRIENQRLNSKNKVAIAGAGNSTLVTVPTGTPPVSDAEACTAQGKCRTVDGLSLTGRVAPRIGITWDPTRTGKSKVYASWGRFIEAVPLDLNIRAINGEKYVITQYVNAATLTSDNWFNPTGSPLDINSPWSVNSVTSLTALTPLDENLKTQFEDQFAVGVEYQFGKHLSGGVRYVDRSLKRIIEDIGTFTNAADPTALTGYVIGNPGTGFFGAPFTPPQRHYRALEFTAQKELADNWHMISSFVWARATGNHEGLYMSGYDQLDPNITALYDIPSFIPNSDGRLRADKPYQFKLHSAYTMKRGLTISEGLLVSAGSPVSAQGPEIVNGYGDGTIFLQQRGSAGRTPAYWSLDAHADYKLPVNVGARRTVNVTVDVFNLFNNHAALEYDQDYIYEGMTGIAAWEDPSNLDAYGNPKFNPTLAKSPFFKTPILFQAPRTVQFGVRVTF